MPAQESGLFGDSAMPLRDAMVPGQVWIDGDTLYWLPQEFRERSPRAMLDAFIEIRAPDAISKFAVRYGVLGLCEHLLPSTHNLVISPGSHFQPPRSCLPLGFGNKDGKLYEPVGRWLELAGQARAILALAWALHNDEGSKLEDWQSAYRSVYDTETAEHVAADAFITTLANKKRRVATVTNWWMLFGGVRVGVVWEKGAVGPILGASVVSHIAPPTFGILATQLTLAVAGAVDLATCSDPKCQRLYLRRGRRVPKGRFGYCSSRCGSRHRQQRYR